MSRKNFCQEVQCPFWDAKNLGCDRFTAAYQCPIRKELPPDVYDSERKFTDSYATQYALYWDYRCLPFERLEARLVSFLISDRHYQQLAYLSELDDPETFKLRRRIDSGRFVRKARIRAASAEEVRRLVREAGQSWHLLQFEEPNTCVFMFPLADFPSFENWLDTWEDVGDE